jgi:hypothetical protein
MSAGPWNKASSETVDGQIIDEIIAMDATAQ